LGLIGIELYIFQFFLQFVGIIQAVGCEGCFWNDLNCVGLGIAKLYSLTAMIKRVHGITGSGGFMLGLTAQAPSVVAGVRFF